MAIPISNVSSSTDTFSDWLDKTNQLLDNLSNKVVTTEANTTGGQTSGNVNLDGIISANSVAVVDSLRGGTVDLPAALQITSNTAFTNSSSNVYVITTNSTSSNLVSNVSSVVWNAASYSIVGGDLTVTSETSFTNNVTISDALVVNSTATIAGNTAISNSVVVDTVARRVAVNQTDTSNTLNRLEVNGNTFIKQNLYVSGLLSTDTLSVATFAIDGDFVVSGTYEGSIIPQNNNFSLGNTSHIWTVFGNSGIFYANVDFRDSANVANRISVGSNSFVNSTTHYVGNSTVNTTISNGSIRVLGNISNVSIGNTTQNTFITSNLLSTGNVTTTGYLDVGTTLDAGNTTVDGFIRVVSTANVQGNLTVNGQVVVVNTFAAGNTTITGTANISTSLGVGLEIVANTDSSNEPTIRVGNTSGNSIVRWNQVSVKNATSETTVNPSLINIGANVTANTSSLKVGNSTVNAIINSTAILFSNTTETSTFGLAGMSASDITSGTLPIARGGTGATNAVDALHALLPANSTVGQLLTSDGDGTYSWSSAAEGGGGAASDVSYTPSGSIPTSADTVQEAIDDLEDRKATKANPTFTGNMAVPLYANTESSANVASTQFVKNIVANSSYNQISNANWKAGGTALSVTNGGTGVQNITGILKGNGTSAFSNASASDIVGAIGSTPVQVATSAQNLSGTISGSSITGSISAGLISGTVSSATNASQLNGISGSNYAVLAGGGTNSQDFTVNYGYMIKTNRIIPATGNSTSFDSTIWAFEHNFTGDDSLFVNRNAGTPETIEVATGNLQGWYFGWNGGTRANISVYPLIPNSDGGTTLGKSGTRWGTIFSTSSTISTSDRRTKYDIENVDLGLSFIMDLRPVKYKKLESDPYPTGEKKYSYGDPKTGLTEEEMAERGSTFNPAEEVFAFKKGTRNRYGLIAQEVKEALDNHGIGDNFFGWSLADKDDPESTQSIAYTEFIAPLIKAVQELKSELDSAKEEIAQLKAQVNGS